MIKQSFHRFQNSYTRLNRTRKSVIASFTVFILLAVSLLPFFLPSKVQAGTFTSAKVTISDSRAALTGVTYDFAFTTTVTSSIKQIDIKFCTQTGQFTDTCTAPTGFSVSGATRTSDNIAGTGRTDSQPGANQFRSVITTPASQATQAVTFSLGTVTNPSTADTSFFPRIITYSDTGTTVIDYAQVAFATLTSTSIAVSANVDPTFTFTVAAVTSGGTVNGATLNITTTASTIPYATLADGTAKIGAHDLSVTSNAPNGYTITTKALATPPLTDGSQNIDVFTGTNATPTVWSAPAGTASSVNTGFFGYTTNDATLGTGTTDRFTSSGGNKWAGTTTSPLEVAYDSGPVGTGQTTRVGWEAEVNENMPPGTFAGTVILVATPTY